MVKKIIFPFFILFMFASVIYAAIPQMIGYEGRLTHTDGSAVIDTTTFTFQMFSTADVSESTIVTQTLTPDANGVFSTVIPFLPGVFDGTARSMEVTVNGETMAPRIPVASAAHAYRALEADTVADATGVGYSGNQSGSYPTVGAALNYLLQGAPPPPPTTSITLNISPSTVEEVGTTVIPHLSWSTSGTGSITSLTVNSSPISTSLTSIDEPSIQPVDYTTASYTVAVTYSGSPSNSATKTITFEWRAYWGDSATTPPIAATVLGLSNNPLTNTRARSVTFSTVGSTPHQYAYYAIPTAWDSGGDPTFTTAFGVLPGWTKTVLSSFTNGSGGSTSYDVWQSPIVYEPTTSVPMTID